VDWASGRVPGAVPAVFLVFLMNRLMAVLSK